MSFARREARLLNLDDAETISRSTGAIMRSEGLQSICCVPLISRSKVLGTLNLGSRQQGFLTPADLQFFTQAGGQVAISLENALSYHRIEELNARLAEEKVYLEDEIRTDNRFEEIIGQSRALRSILKQVETVAPTDSTVLIYGETGTGKELLARAIHDLSSRRQGTFVKLNCAAIPYGPVGKRDVRPRTGRLYGAIAQRIGRFELAHRGSMFLDEVGEIPLELQTKLLRVLQEREFERLGSSRTIRTDARLVAATNRDLSEMVEDREFRADLYYRLNVFPIAIPALRDRRDDIPLLVRYFVQQLRAADEQADHQYSGRVDAGSQSISLAGEHSRAAEFHRARRHYLSRPGTAGSRARIEEDRGRRGRPDIGGGQRDAILKALREAGGRVGGSPGRRRDAGDETDHAASSHAQAGNRNPQVLNCRNVGTLRPDTGVTIFTE